MIEWLNDNAGAVQTCATVALVIVTIIYVAYTARLSGDARESRMDALRPVIAVELVRGGVHMPGKFAQCRLSNIGPGPALDVKVSAAEEGVPVSATSTNLGVMEAGRSDPSMRQHLVEVAEDGSDVIVVRYLDVFGNAWVSDFFLPERDRARSQTLRVRRDR